MPISMITETVPAGEVTTEVFLVDLDYGYVVEVGTPPGYVGSNGMAMAYDNDMVQITFHDADGYENYLIVGSELPIKVGRQD